MSVITRVSVVVEDLDALDEAATDLGYTLHRNCNSYEGYGENPCDHKISTGRGFEVGIRRAGFPKGFVAPEPDADGNLDLSKYLVLDAEGELYMLVFDEDMTEIDVAELRRRYTIRSTMRRAAERGDVIREEKLPNGKIRLHVHVGGGGSKSGGGTKIGAPANW